MAIATLYTELDLDLSKFQAKQKKLLEDIKKVGTASETALQRGFTNLGITSDGVYKLMVEKARVSYERIAQSAKKSADEQFRAQSAMVAKVNSLNQQMTANPLYETLGIKSQAAYKAQEAAIMASYNTIKNSGMASSEDLIRIERAKNAKLKELNNEMVGNHEMSMASMTRAVLSFYAAYYVISSVVRGISDLFLGGVKTIDEMKISAISVAAQITSMQGTSGDVTENFRKNLIYTKALVPVLMEIDASSFANLDNLQKMTMAMSVQGVILDINKKKQIDAVTDLSNTIALFTANSTNQQHQFSQEVKALFSGQIRPGIDMVATAMDQLIKRQGVYADGLKGLLSYAKENNISPLELMEPYLIGMREANKEIEGLWATVSSSIKTSWMLLQQGLFADFHKSLVENGRKMNEWLRKNADDIVKSISDIASGLKYATEAALLFLGITVGLQVATAAWMALSAAWAAGTIVITLQLAALAAWEFFVTGSLIKSVSTLGGAMKATAGVFAAFFIGWEIGGWLNNFEWIRKAGVHMVYGIVDAWAYFVKVTEKSWALIQSVAEKSKAIFTDTKFADIDKQLFANFKAIEETYKKEKALRAGMKKEQLYDVSDVAIAKAKAAEKAAKDKIETPEIKGAAGGASEEMQKSIDAAKRLAESWKDMKRTLENKIAMEGLSDLEKELFNIRFEAEKLIEDYKSKPGAVTLIKKVQVMEEGTVKRKAEEAKYKDILADIKNAEFELANIGKTQLEKDLAVIKQKSDAFRSEKIDEVTITKWAELQKQIAENQAEKKAKEDSEKFAKDKADAYRTMYGDMKDQTQEYYNFQVDALQKEAENYIKLTNDKVLVDKWYLKKKKELDQELAISGDNFYEGAKAQYEQMTEDLLTWGKVGATTMEDMSSNMQQTFSTIFMDVWDQKLKTAEDYFMAFKRSIAQAWADLMSEMITQWIRQQVITGLLTLASAGAGGGAGAGFAALGASGGSGMGVGAQSGGFTSAFLNHGGWAADDYAPTRNVPLRIFDNAQRYHEGIGPDERPAIIRKDEGVFTQGQMKAIGGNLSKKETQKTEVRVDIANINSPEMFDAYMASPRGKNSVLNILSSNPGKVSRIIRAA